MSEDADFNAYQEYGKDPDVARIREEVKRKFRESLEALIEKVNKQIQEELHIDDKTQSELDEAAKEFLRRPEVSAVPYCTGPNTWELLTPEDVRFLIDCGYLID